MYDRFARWRLLLAVAGLALTVVALAPPAATQARHYATVQALQFAVLAVVVPALLVLGAPWRLISGPDRSARRAGAPAGERDPAPMPLADRLAAARSHQPAGWRTWAVVVVFVTASIGWRLPPAVDALVRYPALTVVEAATLIAAGCALWLELVESPPLLPRISRPQRAAFAAAPMWALWAAAYILGFSETPWFSAITHGSRQGPGMIADQELAAFVLFAVPGLCFVPVVYASVIRWLRDSASPDDELREIPAAGGQPGPAVPRPPRGWRSPSS